MEKNARIIVSFISIATGLLVSCNSNSSNNTNSFPKKTSQKSEAASALPTVPKDTLLSLIGEAINTIASKECDLKIVEDIFLNRASKYGITQDPQDEHTKPNNLILGHRKNRKASCNILLTVPKLLRNEIKFSELKKRFGNSPLISTPDIHKQNKKIITLFKIKKGKQTISLLVESIQKPGIDNNQLLTIYIYNANPPYSPLITN